MTFGAPSGSWRGLHYAGEPAKDTLAAAKALLARHLPGSSS
jgi:hypothetical protein